MASRSVQTILNSIDQYQRLVGLIYNKYRGCVKILDRTLPDQIVNSARKFNYIRNFSHNTLLINLGSCSEPLCRVRAAGKRHFPSRVCIIYLRSFFLSEI